MTEPNGMIGVGETDMDLLGSDIDNEYLDSLPNIEFKSPYVNQSTNSGSKDYAMACTMMSSYVGLLSIFGGDEDLKEKKEILDEGIKNGYVIGKGRWTFSGVKSAVKVWNRNHSKKAIYVRCRIGDDTYNKLLKKGYPFITSRKNNVFYSKDKYDNSFIDGVDYSKGNWGHAICFAQGKHCNTYPKGKSNVFGVKSIEKLAENGFYSKNVYAIIPEKNNEKEEAQKRKLTKLIMLLNSTLWKLSGKKTKEVLHNTNEYFRNKGF